MHIQLIFRAVFYLLGFVTRKDFHLANNLVAAITAEFSAYRSNVEQKLAQLETVATTAEQQAILDSIREANAALNAT